MSYKDDTDNYKYEYEEETNIGCRPIIIGLIIIIFCCLASKSCADSLRNPFGDGGHEYSIID